MHVYQQARCSQSEAGSVTAETAIVMPLLALLTLCMCWLLTLGIAQVMVVDAARDAARAFARGERPDAVESHVRRTAPGSQMEISSDGELVTVTVTTRVEPPTWLLLPFQAVRLHADSSVMDESDDEAL